MYYELGLYGDYTANCESYLAYYPNDYEELTRLTEYYIEKNQTKNAVSLLWTTYNRCPEDENIRKLYLQYRGSYSISNTDFDELSEFWNGGAVFRKNDLYGLISNDGRVIIPAQYDAMGVYSANGAYAPVKKGDDEYYIDLNGYRKLATFEDYGDFGIFSEGVATAKANGLYGFINSSFAHTSFMWEDLCALFNGLSAARLDGKWAILNNDLEPVTQYIYEDIIRNDFSVCSVNGLIIAKKDGKYGILDKEANNVVDFIYDDASPVNGGGGIAVKKGDSWGYIRPDGDEMLPFEYEQAKSFSYGYAAAKKDGLWGVIDANGLWLIEPEFEDIKTINSSGYIAVKRNGTWDLLLMDLFA